MGARVFHVPPFWAKAGEFKTADKAKASAHRQVIVIMHVGPFLAITRNTSRLMHMAPGVVGAAHQRPRFHVAKAQFLRFGFQVLKLGRGNVPLHGKLIFCGSQILSYRDDIAVDLPQILERRHNLLEGLADPEHQA